MIKIDHRETHLKSYFSDPSKSDSYRISFQLLQLGDILLADSRGNDKILIERKTLSDLAASIKSGRYREQKYRALDTFSPENIIFLIEGTIDPNKDKVNGIPVKTLHSACLNIIMRDKLRMIQTTDSSQTIQILDLMFQKWIQEGAKWTGPNKKRGKAISKEQYLQTLVPSKKKNLTPDICYRLQLSQIPGISTKLAKVIATEYKCMGELIQAVTAPMGMDQLSSLSCNYTKKDDPDKKKVSRKLGKKVAMRIYYFLTGDLKET